MNKSLFRLSRFWIILLVLAGAAGTGFGKEPPAQPRISRIAKGTNLVITVRVPGGWQSVTLESRKAPGLGAWVPRAVLRAKPVPAKVAFQMALSNTGLVWRVRGERKSSYPLSFFAGPRAFPRRQSSLWRAGPGLGIAYALRGDGNPELDSGVPSPQSRQVSESDIWKKTGDTLYVFNQYRGLQVIDLSSPDAPALRGELSLPAVGEQMYVLDSTRVALLAREPAAYDQSRLLIVDVSGAAPALVASLPLEGAITESRLVGSALYVALQRCVEVAAPGVTEWQVGTAVVSVDLSAPAAPVARSEKWYVGEGTAVMATDRFLFLALQGAGEGDSTTLKVLDITAADGTLAELATFPAAGRIGDKFKMNLSGTVFSAFSESFQAPPPGDESEPGSWLTTLETFSLAEPTNPVPLGRLELAPGERLFATRFDGSRAYAVTFEQVDPLWIVDLADPAHPAVAGSVEVPGWSTYIHPLGNRLVTVGVEDGKTAVSLFDVGDPAKAKLASRVRLGGDFSWSEANWDEKAFSVFPDEGLILIPFEGWSNGVYASRVSLVDLGESTLAERGVISGRRPIRRTLLHRDRLVVLSGRELLSVDVADRDEPVVTAVLELSRTVNRVLASGDYLLQLEDASSWSRNGQAVLRVAAKAKPDIILASRELGLDPVVGAAVRGGYLHLLQRPGWETNLVMTVVDLTALPALGLAGQVEVPAGGTGYGEFEAVWPSADLLVWVSRSTGYGIMPLFDVLTTVNPATLSGPVAMDAGVSFRPCPWWYQGGVQLLAVNVAEPASPAFVSGFSYSPEHSWGFSAPFTAQGRIYLSHEQSKPVALPGKGAAAGLVMAGTGAPGNVYGEWRVGEFMDVIDYAEPAFPTARRPVRLPGQLAGVSPDGALVYTVGSRRAFIPDAAEENEALAVCAYDGVHAYLVDHMLLPRAWPRPVRVNEEGVAFVGRASLDEDRIPSLEAWALSAAGRFERTGSAPLTTAASEINCFGSLLAVQESSGRIALFDAADPAQLTPCGGSEAAGGLWPSLGRAWGDPADGLWFPLDDYGLLAVPVLRP
jgi:hypothetical protein